MLYLMRHGESEGNVNVKAYKEKGHDLALTKKGVQQVSNAAQSAFVKGITPTHLHSSPLFRAKHSTYVFSYELASKMVKGSHSGTWATQVVHSTYELASHPKAEAYHDIDWREFSKTPDYVYGAPKEYRESFRQMVNTRCAAYADYVRTLHAKFRVKNRLDPTIVLVAHDFFLRGLRYVLDYPEGDEDQLLKAIQFSSAFVNGQLVHQPFSPS